MPTPEKTCPKCGSSCHEVLVTGRKLQLECRDEEETNCDWESEPYTPTKRAVRTTKRIATDESGWCYEGFDQYGRTFVHSESFGSEAACLKAAKAEVDRMAKFPGYGKCSAVVWPPTTIVTGKLVR